MKKARTLLIAAAALIAAAPLIITPAFAADVTWNGLGANGNWNTASNWAGVVAPVANDVLIFDGGNGLTNTNNLTAGTQINGINFTTGASAFSLNGNAIQLGGSITNASGNLQSINFWFTNTADIRIDTGSEGILIPTARIYGTAGSITKVGDGTLYLGGNSAGFSNSFIIAEGTVVVATNSTAANPLGQNGTGTYMSNNTKLIVERTAAGSASLNGTFYVTDGAQITMGVTTDGVTNAIGTHGSSAGYGQGVTIVKTGAGILAAGNTSTNNTNWGITTPNTWLVNEGLLMAKDQDYSLGNSNNRVILNGGGLRLNSTSLVAARTIELSNVAGNQINITNVGSSTIAGKITGDGGFSKTGVGTITLAGTNDYKGKTTVAAGTLQLSNTGSFSNSSEINLGTAASQGTLLLTNKASGYTFGTNQTVSGYGAINIGAGNTVTVAGTLAPGNSAGIITNTGNLTLDGTASTVMELAGSGGVAGVDFDQLQVSGTFTYGGTLTITNWGGYTISTPTNYALFTFAGYSGNFASVNIEGNALTYSALTTNWSGTISGTTYTYQMDTGYLNVVPEPSTYALLGLSGLALAAYRLRRRNR